MKKIYIVILYLLGIAAFGYLIYDFGIDNIFENIKETGWWFAPILGIWGITYLLNAFSFKIILGKDASKLGFGKIINATVSGFAINYITPFITLGGEPYRIYVLKKYISLSKAIATVTSFTIMHMLSHFVLWILTVPVLFTMYFIRIEHLRVPIGITFVILLFLIYFLFSRSRNGFFSPLADLLLKLPLGRAVKKKIISWEHSIKETDEKIISFYKHRKNDFFKSLGIEFIARIISSFEFYFALHAVGYTPTILEAILINSMLSLILNILFFMPLQLGTREGGIYLVLKILSVGVSQAVFIALVVRVRELFWIMIGLIMMKFEVGEGKDYKLQYWEEEEENHDHKDNKKAQV